MKKERIGFAVKPNYLPVKSMEKYLLEKLVKNVDSTLFRELNDYVFQGKSLDIIVKEYTTDIKKGVYKDSERIANGKLFYEKLAHELRQIRKSDNDLATIIVDYLFSSNNSEINELSAFLVNELHWWKCFEMGRSCHLLYNNLE